jgi:hypothetical protein
MRILYTILLLSFSSFAFSQSSFIPGSYYNKDKYNISIYSFCADSTYCEIYISDSTTSKSNGFWIEQHEHIYFTKTKPELSTINSTSYYNFTILSKRRIQEKPPFRICSAAHMTKRKFNKMFLYKRINNPDHLYSKKLKPYKE